MGSALGFETLEEETRIDALPVEGEMPGWLHGSLLRTGPAKFEVGEQRDEPLVRWAGDAAPVRLRRRPRLLREPVPREQGLSGGGGDGGDQLLGVRHRSVPVAVQARDGAVSPALSDNCNVSLVKLGERFVAMTETPIPVEFDPETLADGRRRLGRSGNAHDRAPAPRSREWRDAQLRGQARTAQPLSLLPARAGRRRRSTGPGLAADPRARLHALVRAHRALDRAGRVPLRRQPAFAGALRSPLHRELPLEAGPRHPVHADRPQRRRGARAVRGRGVLRLPPRQRLRGRGRDGRRRHQHVRRRRDRPEPLPRQPPQRRRDPAAGPEPVHDLAGSGDGRRRASHRRPDRPPAHRLRPLQRAPVPLRLGVGTDGTGFFDRIVRGDLEQRTSTTWSEPDCWPGEPVSSAAPARPTRGTECCSRSSSTARRGRRSCSSSTRRRLGEIGRARVPHHIPFGFHGQYAAAA